MNSPVLSVAEMRSAEQAAMAEGVSEWELMQRAGEGAAQWVLRAACGRPVTILCGPGNNGGDGYVIAQFLLERGVDVHVIAPAPPATQTAQTARAAFLGSVLENGEISTPLVVDCLFGYGLSREVGGAFANLLISMSAHDCYRIAIDLPSSIQADSGEALGPIADYDLTLALGAFKPAHFLMPNAPAMGQLRLVDIGLNINHPMACLSQSPHIAAPATDAHKYLRGLVAVVAGPTAGAPVLAAEAAMRSGAGYVKLLTDFEHGSVPADLVVERGELNNKVADPRITSILVGPGLGRDRSALDRLSTALETGKPVVVDADALRLLDPDMLEGCDPSRLCLTPHEGELTSLCHAFDIEGGGKLARVQRLHDVTGMTILAKGPDSILCSLGKTWFFERGSSWLSVAGSGDVLAGILAARLAVHGDPALAVREAVALHNKAASLAGPSFTAGMLAHCVSAAMGALQ